MILKDLIFPFTAWKNFFREPVSLEKPKDKEGAPRYRGFHFNDISKCIGCGSCEEICQNAAIDMSPVPGISATNGNSGLRPKIDYGRCCWCALCVDICPTGSLRMTNEYTWIEEGSDNFRFIPGAENKSWDSMEKGYTRAPGYNLVDYDRVKMQELSPAARDNSFIEIVKGYSYEEAAKEADRCLACGICVAACPAHMDIPGYISQIRENNVEDALRIVYETNPFPEACGRICTHKCEEVCALSHQGEPVAIRWLKRYIADHIPADQYSKVLGHDIIEKSDKKVAVIGAGPAGLSAAYFLSLLGYSVTVFEALEKAGGMMRYGIPEYRLPYESLDKDIDYIKSLGVEIRTGIKAGKDISLETLHSEYDAVFAGTGLHLGRSTGIPGSDHPEVYQAADLLREITLGKEIKLSEKILVVGGGNVAMDIARSCARLQKRKFGKVDITVTTLETCDEMPADKEEIIEGEEEGICFVHERGPLQMRVEDGQLKGLETLGVVRIFDDACTFDPKYNYDDTLFLPADMIIESIGQNADMSFLSEEIRKELKFAGRRISVDHYFQTNLEWFFVGGDVVMGPDVVTSINNGHKAAIGIDLFLRKK